MVLAAVLLLCYLVTVNFQRCAEKLREKRMDQFECRRQMEAVVRETVTGNAFFSLWSLEGHFN